MNFKILILLAFLGLTHHTLFSQDTLVYKTVDTLNLIMEVHRPENFDVSKDYPALVFFFGGGWIKGGRGQFLPHAIHFAERGAVCFLVDYRILNKHNTTPFESLEDAKSAIRFV